MEALYEKAIAKLQQRVGSLESKLSTPVPAPTGSSQRKSIVVSAPPPSNQVPERANIGGPQTGKSGGKPGGARAVPKIGRLVPGSKAASVPNELW